MIIPSINIYKYKFLFILKKNYFNKIIFLGLTRNRTWGVRIKTSSVNQLHYKTISLEGDSNTRPMDLQSTALPTELSRGTYKY